MATATPQRLPKLHSRSPGDCSDRLPPQLPMIATLCDRYRRAPIRSAPTGRSAALELRLAFLHECGARLLVVLAHEGRPLEEQAVVEHEVDAVMDDLVDRRLGPLDRHRCTLGEAG